MIRTLVHALAASSTLALHGCCCCSLPTGLIPDDVADELAREAAEQAIELGTGVDVEANDNSFSIASDEGTFKLAGGQAGRDPRIPVAPWPNCEVAGGATLSDKAAGTSQLSYAQQGCAGSVDAFRTYFRDQLVALGMTVNDARSVQDGKTGYMMMAEAGDDGPVRALNVMLQEGDNGVVDVAVMCTFQTPTAEGE